MMVVNPRFGCGSLVEEFEDFPPWCSGRPIRNDHSTECCALFGEVATLFAGAVADSDLSVEVTPRHHLGGGSTQPTRLDSPSANRFAALRDDDDPFAEDSSNESERPIDHPEFVDGIQEVPLLPRDDPVAQVRRPQGEVIQVITVNPPIRAALRSLDEVDVQHLFRDRAVVIKSLPSLIRGAYKSAMRMALWEAADRASARDEVGLCRAWKLFLLLRVHPQVSVV